MVSAAKLIAKEIQEKAYQQRWVARKSGVTHFVINKWVNMNPPPEPRWIDIVRVAEVLKLPLEYLKTGRDRDYSLRRQSVQQWIDFIDGWSSGQIYEALGVLRVFYANKLSTNPGFTVDDDEER